MDGAQVDTVADQAATDPDADFLAAFEEEEKAPAEKEEKPETEKQAGPGTDSAPAAAEEAKKPEETAAQDDPTKQLEDLQRKLTESETARAAEVSGLKKQVADLAAAVPQKDPVEALIESLPEAERQEAKEFLEDYPVFRNLLRASTAQAKAPAVDPEALQALAAKIDGWQAQQTFETSVLYGYRDAKGEYVEGHPDAYKVIASQAFKDYVAEREKTTPGISRTADPAVVVGLLGDFKSASADKAGKVHDRTVAERTREALSDALTPGTSGGGGEKKASKDDFDAGFNIPD